MKNYSQFTEKLSALVPQCLRTFYNGLLRFTRNDGQFTVHRSQFTQAAFTLAETLIVIGIIGVVAALTLPNLNHATGDKETVTRLMKAYSMLNEANDRAVATYGPISTWKSNEKCAERLHDYWMKRIGEFLKISKSCDEEKEISCDDIFHDEMDRGNIMYQLSDGMTIGAATSNQDCYTDLPYWNSKTDICIEDIYIDVNGKNKGKNYQGYDTFRFGVSDSAGLMPTYQASTSEESHKLCAKQGGGDCAAWVLEYGNLDYLKTDEEGKCNDNPSIILDGVNNTSCH